MARASSGPGGPGGPGHEPTSRHRGTVTDPTLDDAQEDSVSPVVNETSGIADVVGHDVDGGDALDTGDGPDLSDGLDIDDVRATLAWWRRAWRRTPRPMRQAIVATIGGTLIALGLALIVLPGPFTMPLIAVGLVVLSSEFAWAERILFHSRRVGVRARDALRRRGPTR